MSSDTITGVKVRTDAHFSKLLDVFSVCLHSILFTWTSTVVTSLWIIVLNSVDWLQNRWAFSLWSQHNTCLKFVVSCSQGLHWDGYAVFHVGTLEDIELILIQPMAWRLMQLSVLVQISVLGQTKWHALFPNVIEADDAHFHGCLHLELTLGIPRGLSITTGSGIM